MPEVKRNFNINFSLNINKDIVLSYVLLTIEIFSVNNTLKYADFSELCGLYVVSNITVR